MTRFALFFVALCLVLASCQSAQETKHQQYIAEGYVLYNLHCANCHQKDGGGLQGLYPAITSEHLKNDKWLAYGIKNGMTAPLVVNGKRYDRPMPANPTLKDLEIAEIITYVNHEFGKNKRFLPVDSVNVWFY